MSFTFVHVDIYTMRDTSQPHSSYIPQLYTVYTFQKTRQGSHIARNDVLNRLNLVPPASMPVGSEFASMGRMPLPFQ